MRTLGLVLVDDTNEFQQVLARETVAAARRAGFAVDVRASGVGGFELAAQIKLIDAWVAEAPVPHALLVLAAQPRAGATAVGLLIAALRRGTPVPAFTSLAGHAWPETTASLRRSA